MDPDLAWRNFKKRIGRRLASLGSSSARGFGCRCSCWESSRLRRGWIFADGYTREYRERAATYDLDRINDLEEPSIILDRNGKEIGRIFVQNRSVIPIEQVPEIFIKALRAGEDSRFLSHHGVDYIGIIRAVILNAQGGNQGASTITQQLARNAYNLKEEAVSRKETTIQRKLVEAFLARRIEDRYSKQEILEFLSEPHLFRQRILRHPLGVAGILRQGADGSDCRRNAPPWSR